MMHCTWPSLRRNGNPVGFSLKPVIGQADIVPLTFLSTHLGMSSNALTCITRVGSSSQLSSSQLWPRGCFTHCSGNLFGRLRHLATSSQMRSSSCISSIGAIRPLGPWNPGVAKFGVVSPSGTSLNAPGT